MINVDNAIILAAGTSSRFAPLSYEKPKSLFPVKGEVLIERQIKQLLEAGINEIIIVVGYMKEQFEYLKSKYNVILVENKEYLERNNNSSIYVVRKYLKNSYICSSDNYFKKNPFEKTVESPYYSAVYSNGYTDEWCISTDEDGFINNVVIGGSNSWYMLGHTFWDAAFSSRFISILESIYNNQECKNKLWEHIYIDNINSLKMKMRKYPNDYIFEFDTLDDLRNFDSSYIDNTKSYILKSISKELKCRESDINSI